MRDDNHGSVTGERAGHGPILPALPAPVTKPVGRDDELARIPRWLANGARLVALTGVPGAGKTRLALHIGQAVQRLTGWPALFLGLVAIDDPALIAGMIATVLALGEDDTPAIDRVTRHLNGMGPALLILDNLEHLRGADAVIAELARSCPEVRILATSRHVLNVPGVHQFEVQPLPVPRGDASRETLRENPAVQLFATLAGRAHFTVTDEDLPDVARICASLDGLPLAIELAAARAASLGLPTLAARLNDRRHVLDLSNGATDQRHRSLRSAIAWSYELLSEDIRASLNRLSVFTDGFSQLAVEQMVESLTISPEHEAGLARGGWYLAEVEELLRNISLDPLRISAEEALRHLIDANLVRASAGVTGTIRYQMMESIREFGLERLEENGESETVRLAHAFIMYRFNDVAGHELWTNRSRSRYWPHVAEEMGNTRSALAWACEPGNAQPTLAGLLVVASWFGFQLRGQISEVRTWIERALAVPGGAEAVRLHAMNSLAFSAWTQGDMNRANELSAFVLGAWKPPYPEAIPGIAHFNSGLVAWQRGDFQSMATSLLTGKQGLHNAGDSIGEGLCNLALGVLARFGGDFGAAYGLLDEAHDLLARSGHEWGAATSRYLAGETAHDEGNAVKAVSLIADGLERYRDQGDIYGSGACVAAMAVFATERNELERAARLFGAAFAMCEHVGVLLPPVDQERYQGTAEMVALRVPATEFQRGRSWSYEQATEEALALAAEIQAGRVPGPVDDPLQSLLTADQRDAVLLLCEGLSVEEIAARLFRDPNTIYDRLARARQRLGVTSNRKLVSAVTALRTGSVPTNGS